MDYQEISTPTSHPHLWETADVCVSPTPPPHIGDFWKCMLEQQSQHCSVPKQACSLVSEATYHMLRRCEKPSARLMFTSNTLSCSPSSNGYEVLLKLPEPFLSDSGTKPNQDTRTFFIEEQSWNLEQLQTTQSVDQSETRIWEFVLPLKKLPLWDRRGWCH